MRILVVLMALGSVAACGPSPVPIPVPVPPAPTPSTGGAGEGPLVLMNPHWDQVCRDDSAPMFFQRVEEVARVEGLVEALGQVVPPPAPGVDPGYVDVAVTWARTGEIRSVHLAHHTLGDEMAGGVLERIAGAVHPHERLVRPVFLRIRVMQGARVPAVRLLPGWSCLPHISHEPDRPPHFPGGASVTASGWAFSPASNPRPTLAVRIRLSSSGEMLEVEPIRGEMYLLPRVRMALSATVFDPGLLNGEPVESTMDLTFRFPA